MSASFRPRLAAARVVGVGVGCAVWLALGGLPAGSLRAADAPPAKSPAPDALSPRDTFRQIIEPIVDAFSRHPDGPNRAFTLRAHVVEATTQRPEFIGTRLNVACQAPDRAIFQFLALDHVVTICRVDQTLWASPADVLAPLLKQVEEKPPTRADREPLAPFRLTIPTRLFWVLFYLVGVQDAGNEKLGSLTCRRLDLRFPEAKKGESLRLWTANGKDGKPRPERVEFIGPDSRATLDLDDAQIAVAAPPGSFEPDATQRANLLNIPVERFRPFMTLLDKEEEKRRKQFIHDHPVKPAASPAGGT